MIDPRIRKLASILTQYSIKIKPGDTIQVSSGLAARPLVLEVCKNILKKGAIPKVDIEMPGLGYTYFKYANEKILKSFPKIAEYNAKNVAGSIRIGAEYNTK